MIARRVVRVLAFALGGLALVGLLAVVTASVVLSHLDSAPLRSRIRAAAHDRGGIDLDYARAEGSLSGGLSLYDVTFPSAPADRAVAPNLVTIKELHVGWSVGALLGTRLGELKLSGLALAVVQDEHGGSSLERWNTQRLAITGPPPPTPPLAHLIEKYLPKSQVSLERLLIEGATVTVLKTRAGAAYERLDIGTLAMTGQALAGAGALDAVFESGTTSKPLALEVVRTELGAGGQEVAGSARSLLLEAALGLACKPRDCLVTLEVAVKKHDLAPALPEGPLLGLRTHLGFEPEHDLVVARVEALSLVDGAAKLSAEVELHDDAKQGLVLRAASGHADLGLLLSRFADLAPPGAKLGTGTFDLSVAPAKAADGSPVAETRIPGQAVAIAAGRALQLVMALSFVEANSAPAGAPAVPARVRAVALTMRAAGGDATLEGKLQGLSQGPGDKPALEVEDLALLATLKPRADGKVDVHASMPLSHLVQRGLALVELRKLTLGVDGVLAQGAKEATGQALVQRFDGEVTMGLGELRQSAKGAVATVEGLQLALGLRDVRFAQGHPAQTQATVALEGKIAAVTQTQGKKKTQATGLGVALATQVHGKSLARTVFKLPTGKVGIEDGGGGPRLAPQPASLTVEVEPLELTALDPTQQLKLRATLALGPLQVETAIDRKGSEVAFELDASAAELGPLSELLRGALPANERAAWAGTGLSWKTKGRARGIDRRQTMTVEQESLGTLTKLSVQRPGLDFTTREAALKLSTRGTLQRHTFEAALVLADPRLNDRGGAGKQTLSCGGSYDLSKPRLDVKLAGDGVLGPDGQLSLGVAFDPPTRRLTYQLDGGFKHLGLAGVLLPAATLAKHHVRFDSLAVKAHAEGALTSVVAKYTPGLPPKFVFEPAPLTAIRGTTSLDFTVTGLNYGGASDLHAVLPALTLHLQTQADPKKLHAEASLDLPALLTRASGHKYRGEKLGASLVVDSQGDLETGTATAKAGFTAASLVQDAAPQYPLGDVELAIAARADAKGSVRIESASFTNALGGTRLDLHGGLDLGPLDPNLDLKTATRSLARAFAGSLIPGRRNLLIEGVLSQRLDAVNGSPSGAGAPLGKGTVTVPFRVESGDLSYLRATAGLKFEEVDLAMPAQGLAVKGLNGFIPVAQDLLLGDNGGFTRVFGATTSAYSRLRFAEQQPFTADTPFVTAQRIEVDLSKKGVATAEAPRTIVLGPLAANLRIDRNLVAIDQLELELLQGKVSGQILIDGQAEDTQLSFRGAVTGLVTAGEKERLDANAALVLWPERRLLEGRIELVRLGTSHLRGLLDLYDPFHADIAANRMRRGLQFGYPKSVRMGFHDGFATLALELGGLASAVRIDEIRGTAIGPVLERYLARPVPPEPETTPSAAPAASQEEGTR